MSNDITSNVFEDMLPMNVEQIAFIYDTYETPEVREAIEAMIAMGADEYQVNCICTEKVYVEEGMGKTCSCGIHIEAKEGKVFATGGVWVREPLEVWHG
jgi:hypothetical protein